MAKSKKYQAGGLGTPVKETKETKNYGDYSLTPAFDYANIGMPATEEVQPELPEINKTIKETMPAGAMKEMRMPQGFAKGGTLLQEGGMLQEGGTVDPVSGNEVPVGSLQEEVRDDIPAQLSEGEFVFPADVVRFIGLERLMKMRQAAKEGLAKMEAMGQMGNSEEATMDDEGEFETELDDILEEIENEKSS